MLLRFVSYSTKRKRARLSLGFKKRKMLSTARGFGDWQDYLKVHAPDISTLKGLRDRAILALLLGCDLRRAEAANLTFDHIQQRDGRWVLVDLLGERNKLRSVPMPAWTKVL